MSSLPLLSNDTMRHVSKTVECWIYFITHHITSQPRLATKRKFSFTSYMRVFYVSRKNIHEIDICMRRKFFADVRSLISYHLIEKQNFFLICPRVKCVSIFVKMEYLEKQFQCQIFSFVIIEPSTITSLNSQHSVMVWWTCGLEILFVENIQIFWVRDMCIKLYSETCRFDYRWHFTKKIIICIQIWKSKKKIAKVTKFEWEFFLYSVKQLVIAVRE